MKSKNARNAEVVMGADAKTDSTVASGDEQRRRLHIVLRQDPIATFYDRDCMNILMPTARTSELPLTSLNR